MPSVISLDIPVLLAGLAALILGRFVLRPSEYQIVCQFVGTFWAQFSFGVNWSLARITPIFSAIAQPRQASSYGWMFIPLAVYVPVTALLLSLMWPIPSYASGPYGDYRVLIQIVNFGFMALSAR